MTEADEVSELRHRLHAELAARVKLENELEEALGHLGEKPRPLGERKDLVGMVARLRRQAEKVPILARALKRIERYGSIVPPHDFKAITQLAGEALTEAHEEHYS